VKKILFIAGTRPEAIKLAPLYLEMQRHAGFDPVFCATGQHQDLFRHGLDTFGFAPDIELRSMTPGQPLPDLGGALLRDVSAAIISLSPAAVVVQGDTMSAYAGAWAAFLLKVPVVHVEAGLRTGDLQNPFPEEANRRAISIIASLHAAPTPLARENLLREGIPTGQIAVTGNTAIDALMHVKARLQNVSSRVQAYSSPETDDQPFREILVTGHRRENFGSGIAGICEALKQIAREFSDVRVTYVLHPNPAVAGPVREALAREQQIRVVAPMNYEDFVAAMIESTFIISDSGGVQEEAPALGKPVLVTRSTTERPEAAALGATRLVGTDVGAIVAAARELLTDASAYKSMATAGSPYGDGHAAAKICEFIDAELAEQPQ